ncbi:MAG TPA: FIST N-terminal domain-containing protein, partial [Methylomirabilota bacterium]|nr:FIST N-terminal domain-containing protein [Methylomirabilota bacterium]
MIAAGSGLATNARADEAAIKASIDAMTGNGAESAEFALVFTSPDAQPFAHEVLHAVRRVTGARAVVGCSGTGVLTERGEAEGVPAVAVLAVSSGGRLLATAFSV